MLPATVAQELCLTGRTVTRTEAKKLGIVREVSHGDVVARALALAGADRRAAARGRAGDEAPTLLEREHLWGFLFDEEKRVFRRALLGEDAAA